MFPSQPPMFQQPDPMQQQLESLAMALLGPQASPETVQALIQKMGQQSSTSPPIGPPGAMQGGPTSSAGSLSPLFAGGAGPDPSLLTALSQMAPQAPQDERASTGQEVDGAGEPDVGGGYESETFEEGSDAEEEEMPVPGRGKKSEKRRGSLS